MFSNAELKKILIKTKSLGEKELKLHLEEAENRNHELEQCLTSQKIISEEQLYQTAASFYNLPFINLKNQTIRKDILFMIPEPLAVTHKIIAFDKSYSKK